MSDLNVRETAARALAEADYRPSDGTGAWESLTEYERDDYRRMADAVLAAVAAHDGLAPLLRAHTYHEWAQDCRCRIAGDDAMDGDDWAAHLADVVRAWLRGES